MVVDTVEITTQMEVCRGEEDFILSEENHITGAGVIVDKSILEDNFGNFVVVYKINKKGALSGLL
jgi:hypothetical protein